MVLNIIFLIRQELRKQIGIFFDSGSVSTISRSTSKLNGSTTVSLYIRLGFRKDLRPLFHKINKMIKLQHRLYLSFIIEYVKFDDYNDAIKFFTN